MVTITGGTWSGVLYRINVTGRRFVKTAEIFNQKYVNSFADIDKNELLGTILPTVSGDIDYKQFPYGLLFYLHTSNKVAIMPLPSRENREVIENNPDIFKMPMTPEDIAQFLSFME